MTQKLASQIKSLLGQAPSFIAGGLSDSGTISVRNEKCQSCEHLNRQSQRCKLCGCYVWPKMRAAAASCPANKWPS